jgi:hypothetical protein
MSRRNPTIELMAVVAATVVLCGCASAPPPQRTTNMRQEAAKELDAPGNPWSECVRAAIPPLDDPHSPSEIVARAAMARCSNEYSEMSQALARTLEPACGQDTDCMRGVLATIQREATRAATDDVVTARVRVAGAQVLKCE